jgi:hypothetical protein
MEDPSAVHPSWNAYFKQVQKGAPLGAAYQEWIFKSCLLR